MEIGRCVAVSLSCCPAVSASCGLTVEKRRIFRHLYRFSKSQAGRLTVVPSCCFLVLLPCRLSVSIERMICGGLVLWV